MPTVKTVSQKMGIKQDSRAILVNAPDKIADTLHLPELDIAAKMTGEFDYIHVFTTSEKKLDQQFSKLKKHLRSKGALWVSWPKARQLNTDLNIRSVIRIGYDHGLVESKGLSVDATWSALKFTHPKKDKVYSNSHGKLKDN